MALSLVTAVKLKNGRLLEDILRERASALERDDGEWADDLAHAMYIAAAEGSLHCGKILLEAGADCTSMDVLATYGHVAMTIASKNQRIPMIKLLLQHGCSINAENMQGMTALHQAVLADDEALMKVLLAADADCKVRDVSGDTALLLAVRKGNVNLLKTILHHDKSCINLKNRDEMTALHVATFETSTVKGQLVQSLLEAGADPNMGEGDFLTPLHIAAGLQRAGILELLADHGGDLNALDYNKCTPLFEAAKRGSLSCVKLLLSRGAHADATDSINHCTPLIVAAGKGHTDIVQLLLDAKCNINHHGNMGQTPLHEATQHRHKRCTKLLLQQGANPNAQNIYQHTPLWNLLLWQKSGVCDVGLWNLLIWANTDLKIVGKSGHFFEGAMLTNLQLCCVYGSILACKILLIAGADTRPLHKWIIKNKLPRLVIEDEIFLSLVKSAAQNPRNLKELCRIQIRICLGTQHIRDISKLPIPKTMKEYIGLRELEHFDDSIVQLPAAGELE